MILKGFEITCGNPADTWRVGDVILKGFKITCGNPADTSRFGDVILKGFEITCGNPADTWRVGDVILKGFEITCGKPADTFFGRGTFGERVGQQTTIGLSGAVCCSCFRPGHFREAAGVVDDLKP